MARCFQLAPYGQAVGVALGTPSGGECFYEVQATAVRGEWVTGGSIEATASASVANAGGQDAVMEYQSDLAAAESVNDGVGYQLAHA
jgi:hypothetical protein